MPKENQKKLLLLPLILLLIGAGVAFMNRGTEDEVQEPAMAPESGAEPAAAVEQPLVADIQSPEIVVRQPEAHVEPEAEPESEPPPIQAAPSGSYRLLSRTLQVPLSHSFLLQIDATEEPIAVGAGGVFAPLGGHLPQRATLLDYTQEVRLGDSVRLKILPESQVLYSDLCTLLLDAPAGPLPAIDELHAAFLSKSGRLQPTPVRSVESRPGGWTVRIEEPVDFCAEVSMDRALLCIDPPTKDHVRLATWTLAELKRAKANELRPLPTRPIALRWKGLETMGNLADRQKLGATFFTGHCEVPGFQSPNALDWLASPPKRSFQSKRTERTYVRVPECITGCTAFFGMGSVASVDLPAVEDWKFGVELFAEALELQESQINNPALLPAATFITLNPMGLGNPLLSGFEGSNWVWGEAGELLHGFSFDFRPGETPRGLEALSAGLALPEVGAMLSTSSFGEAELLASQWVPLPKLETDLRFPNWMSTKNRNRFQIKNESNWVGEAELHLISLDTRGVSVRSMPFRWPSNSTKAYRRKSDEIAWIVTSRTAKASSGLLGPNLDPFDDRKTSQIRRDYDIQLNLEHGWSALLLGELTSGSHKYSENLEVDEIHRGRLRSSMRSIRAASMAGTATASSTLSSAVVDTELGPWGLKILSSDAAPSFLDLGFPNGPVRQIQPHEKTTIFVLNLAKD